jgi:hypothetical protein
MEFPVLRWLVMWLSQVELFYDVVGSVAIGFICKASSSASFNDDVYCHCSVAQWQVFRQIFFRMLNIDFHCVRDAKD